MFAQTTISNFVQSVNTESMDDFLAKALPGISLDKPEQKAEMCLRLGGGTTQTGLAALLINMGVHAAADIDRVLEAQFPKIATGKSAGRYGSYYLSLARKGNLKGCTVEPPKAVPARAKASKLASANARVAQLEELLRANGIEIPAAE